MFKAYDIRGIAGEELTPQFAGRLGKSIVAHLNARCIAVARDIRESGPALHDSFIESGTRIALTDLNQLMLQLIDALHPALLGE